MQAAIGTAIITSSSSAGAEWLAAATVAALQVARRVDLQHQRRREAKVATAVAAAAQALGESLEDLERRVVASDAHTELAAAVLRAAATTLTAEEKVEALGRVLAFGLQAGDQYDPAAALAAALHDLERPHVALLRTLATVYESDQRLQDGNGVPRVHRWRYLKAHEQAVLEKVAGGRLTLPGVLATLSRHGLVQEETLKRTYRDEVQGWRLSELGQLCLQMLDAQYVPVMGRG